AEKFISSYLGKGTLAPAVRSADAKVSRANRRGEHHGPRSSVVADRNPDSDHPSDLAVWRTSLDVRARPVRRAATERKVRREVSRVGARIRRSAQSHPLRRRTCKRKRKEREAGAGIGRLPPP